MSDRDEREQRVTPLELFFDLVVVFAITQVTGFLSRDPTWGGLLRGLLLLGALWWAWGAYAWLTNTLDPEEGAVAYSLAVARFRSCGFCTGPAPGTHRIHAPCWPPHPRAAAGSTSVGRHDPGASRSCRHVTGVASQLFGDTYGHGN
jgi:hypothetical protein